MAPVRDRLYRWKKDMTRILIADADSSFRQKLCELLNKDGCEVEGVGGKGIPASAENGDRDRR